MAAACIQTTKGLYFTFTLLCLVCLARSLMTKDELEKFKLEMKKKQQEQDSLKAEYESLATNLSLIDHYVNNADEISARVKKSDLPDDFPSVDGFLQNNKDLIEKLKTDIGRGMEKLGTTIETGENELRNMKKEIKFHEENQAEF